MRRLSLPPLLVLALLAVPASASAVNIRVGIGDQSPKMFDNAKYQALNLKITRYFIEWDAITNPDELDKADAFVAAANASGVKVLMHISTSDIKASKPKLPSVAQYRTRVGALIKRYKRLGVKEWGAWNEANHKTQPTAKSPRSAALFFGQMRKLCTGCTIVALDVLDQRGVEAYIKSFFRFAGKDAARVRIVGIHNYSEVNRRIAKGTNTYPGTRRIIQAVQKANKKAKFWYTETGGLTKQGTAFPCDDARAANRTRYMFTLAKRYQRYVQRLYTYNWTPSTDCDESEFDGGLLNVDGSVRPAYNVFKSSLRSFKR
ncbi:MAG TPA: hypothetical protein VGO80_20675 [Solirubrobacteraceae bacterium]|nr:hypothetical protein [Solirubrobacteraceae bacterium]